MAKQAEGKTEVVKPFLKWAGGKRQILKHLLKYLPADIDKRTYREPFLGGGALFFALKPTMAILSDANEHLIRCYHAVRDNPDLVSGYLYEHVRNDCERYYYHVRDQYNQTIGYSIAQAARFIYLNKTCYNGIFRVNSSGKYNVPCGRYDSPSLPSRQHLKKVSRLLNSGTKIFAASFEKTLAKVKAGDFVYLDPPYPPLNGTSSFTSYTKDKFDDEDQRKVANIAKELDSAGCLVMVSNASTRKIRKLYAGFNIRALEVTRFITCKSKRHRVIELVITNY